MEFRGTAPPVSRSRPLPGWYVGATRRCRPRRTRRSVGPGMQGVERGTRNWSHRGRPGAHRARPRQQSVVRLHRVAQEDEDQHRERETDRQHDPREHRQATLLGAKRHRCEIQAHHAARAGRPERGEPGDRIGKGFTGPGGSRALGEPAVERRQNARVLEVAALLEHRAAGISDRGVGSEACGVARFRCSTGSRQRRGSCAPHARFRAPPSTFDAAPRNENG